MQWSWYSKFFRKNLCDIFFTFVSCCLKHTLTFFKWNQYNFKIFARFWSILMIYNKFWLKISIKSRLIWIQNLIETLININLKCRWDLDQSWLKISAKLWSTWIENLDEISTNFDSRSWRNLDQFWFKIFLKFWSTWIQDLDKISTNLDLRS